MKLHTHEEMLTRHIGAKGTPKRDEFDQKVEAEIEAYRVGEAIRKARLARNLTQAEVGERMGINRGQVSRLESGKSMTVASMMRAFKAIGVEVSLDMKGIGTIAL